MKKLYLSVLVLVGFLLSLAPAYAATPNFSAFYTGNGDYVQINIANADPNYSVILNHNSIMTALGTTNSSGAFSLTISSSQYNILASSIVSVTVDGQTSGSLQWPYTSSSGSFTLSQTNIALTPGQSSVITASIGGPFYLSSNSSPIVANASISGSQITVTANTAGTTNMSVCATSNSGNCATIYVTVSGSGTQTISFSQNNISMSAGQTATISITGGSGLYSIINNSNPTSIQTNVSGSVVTLYGQNVVGSAAITVCATNTSYCGVINATVGNTSNYSALTFNPSNPALTLGQAASTVSIIGGVAPYYISSNSNNTIVLASLSNNILTLSPASAGSATVTVCSATNVCGSELVTVNASSGGITFSPSTVTLTIGQSTNVSIYGSSNYYISSNSNPSIVTATISGTSVALSGNIAGTDSIGICSVSGQCNTLFVTVGSSGSTSNAAGPILSQLLSVSQQVSLLISGGSAPYYLSPTSNATFSATIANGTTLTITGLNIGASSVNVCSSNGSCTTVYINVSSSAPAVTSGTGSTSSSYTFTKLLTYGMTDAEITQLQSKLTGLGIYSGPITGYYGDLTAKAVKEFQTEHGISAVGYVGPSTRAALNR